MVGAAVAAVAVVGGVIQSQAAGEAAEVQAEAGEAGIAEQRAARESFEQRTERFRELGLLGAEQLTGFLEDPFQQLEEINPLVNFLRDQGFEAIQETAAAKGRLGAGGTTRDLAEFNTNLAATIVPQLQNQRFNQLFNVAGLGANVAAGQGTAGLQTATNISNLLGNIGASQAAGIQGQAGAITGTLQNVAGAFGAFPSTTTQPTAQQATQSALQSGAFGTPAF